MSHDRLAFLVGCAGAVVLAAFSPTDAEEVMTTSVRLDVATTWNGEPIGLDEQVEIIVTGNQAGLVVEIDAPFHGDPPPAAPAGSTPKLWRHEVVELFVAGEALPGTDQVPYTEVELGPHGHYLVLRLRGVRHVVEEGLPLAYEATIAGKRWQGQATIPWSYLPAGSLTANAYAIHGLGEDRRYLASAPVPGDAPDFHQPSRFRPLPLDRP